jgi:acetyl esterase/lipase
MTHADQGRPGIFVPARFVPTPRTISPEAQAFLSSPPPVEQTSMPALEDKAGWRAHIQQADRVLIAITAQQAQAHPAETVTHSLSAAPIYEITPKSLSHRNEKWAILYIHGGGFMMGGGQAAAYAAMPIASLAETRTYSVDYRMPPDHPFPAGLDDCVEAYRWLLERYKPENIALYGPSAGGNLAPACILKARDLGLPLPAACAVHSPAADCTESGDSYETNDTIDIVLKHRSGGLFALYADGHDLTDPLISPIFGDYAKGFPPTILTSGTRDLLLSSTVLLHRALRRAGVKAELHVWEAMTHTPFFGAPEEKELLIEQTQFMLCHMGPE